VSLRLRLALLVAAMACALPAGARTVIDDSHLRVDVPENDCRIVSLAPGTTAMLYAAGAGHCLVGTIAHSKEPEEAASLPVVGDAETLDFERLLALRPSVIVVAVDVVQRMRIDRLRELGLPVYQVHVTSLAGMPDSIERLGRLTGTGQAAGARAAALRGQLETLAARFGGRKPQRVLYQIWDKPIYTIGGRHVITDALRLCGAVNVFADLGTAAPAVTREAVLTRDPAVILASGPPGVAEEWLAEWRKYPALRAVRAGNLVSYSDERIDRMGPSVIDATANLCAVIARTRRE
jgi:iron complex transport system substrate-binding protein